MSNISLRNKKIIYWCFSLILVFGASILAPDVSAGSWDPQDDFDQILENPPEPTPDGELAHLWFELMFGEFIWSPWGQECTGPQCVTVLSTVIGFTNVLALIMGVVIAYYVILGGSLNTAQSGEILGRSWSSSWLPIRNAIGFGLIMPAAGVGGGVMSTIQIVVIWLIIIGSNAGSLLWSGVAEQFAEGTPVVKINNSNGMEPAVSLFQSLLCARTHMEETYSPSSGSHEYASIQYYNSAGRELTMRAGNNLSSGIFNYTSRRNLEKISFGERGICGSITFPDLMQQEGDEITNELHAEAVAAFKREVRTLGTRLTALVNDIYDHETAGSAEALLIGIEEENEDVVDAIEDWGGDFYEIALDFDIESRENMLEAMTDSTTLREWKQRITQGGWAQAGVWYFEVSRYQGMVNDAMNKVLQGFNPPTGKGKCKRGARYRTCTKKNITGMKSVANHIAHAGVLLGGQSTRNRDNGMRDQETIYADADLFQLKSEAMDPESIAEDPEGSIEQVKNVAAKGLLNAMTYEMGSSGANGLYGQKCVENQGSQFEAFGANSQCSYGASNPFYTVSSIGHNLVNVGVFTWGAMGVMYVVSGSVEDAGGIIGDVVDVGGFRGGFAKAIMFAVYSLLPLASAAVSQGFVLAFVVPFLPLMTWTFMICGYLLSVVEAVVAAPLAIIMMVTPEGEGISGTRLERAISLIAMIILKPSLMIIGLIASMTLANILFAVMNQFFWSGTAELTNGGAIEFVFVITLYVGTAYKLCQYVVSIMYKLPEQILDWFTSGASRSFGENDIGGFMAGASAQAGSSVQGMSGALANSIGAQKKIAHQKYIANQNAKNQ